MRSISALDVRARFGQVLDEAAAGERFIVERAGQPVAAIVPLRDLEAMDPDVVRARRMAAVDQLVRLRARGPRPAPVMDEAVTGIMVKPDRRGRRVRPASNSSPTVAEARADPDHRDRRDRPADEAERKAEIAAGTGTERDRRDRPADEAERRDHGSPADTGWRQW